MTHPDPCIHSKYVRGCPACARHWLRYFGITRRQPITNNEPGIYRWNPAAWIRTTRTRRR
jgi:hypothetical protein